MSNSVSANLFNQNLCHHISADLPVPLYHQLYSLIKGFILDGSLHHGDKLPSEQELAELFQVSRITAKRAVNELAAEQLVQRARGKGTHIIYKYSPKPVQAPMIGVHEEIDSIAKSSTATVLESALIKPPQSIGTEFALKRSDSLFHLVRIREHAGGVFGYFDSWSAGVQAPVNSEIFIHESRHKYFREGGMYVSHIKQTIGAIAASPLIAKYLNIEPGAPLLSLVRRSYKQNGDQEELVDYLLALYNTELFQYQMDVNLD
jgi:GntR family transcriptional regulator|tara:strand:+ start:189 stop:971 length:783 start_codon:yes stop_codon:yes gene_type:complete